eukprot:2223666-Pleurochrysis_carterae.AAC.3
MHRANAIQVSRKEGSRCAFFEIISGDRTVWQTTIETAAPSTTRSLFVTAKLKLRRSAVCRVVRPPRPCRWQHGRAGASRCRAGDGGGGGGGARHRTQRAGLPYCTGTPNGR